MLDNTRLIIREDGSILTPGIDYGPKPPQLMHRAWPFLVIKTLGHTGWSSRGERSYYPTRYHLVEVDGEPCRIVHTIETREPGAAWSSALTDLKNRADELSMEEA